MDEPHVEMSPRPRIWPVFVVLVATPVMALGVTTFLMVVALLARGSGPGLLEAVETWRFEEFVRTPGGLLVAILPTQVCFAAAGILPALLGGARLRDRLGLRAPRLRPAWLLVFVSATLVPLTLAQMLAAQLFPEPGEGLRALAEMLKPSGGTTAVLIYVLVGLAPAFCEEVFFRGYVLTRLLERWPPVLAILFVAAVFAVAHLDLQHAVVVFPLGIWLGVLVWRTGSIVPAIVTHGANNVLALVAGERLPEPESLAWEGSLAAAIGGVFLFSVGAFAAAVVALVREGRRPAT